ncbi:MAG: antitoxin Xre/MbcA/ParS toxin-binding domain-containing protein [Pseudomonadota bacterium]
MTAPNRAFDGLKPVEVVERHGMEGLAAVSAYLDGALQQ